MSDARDKFRELTRVFDPIYQPRQDAADGPGASYVPETHEDYRRQLDAALDLNDSAKLLVAGQPGCGKTTLLLSVAQTLRKQGRIVAFVDLEAQTAVQDFDSVEMHLAALSEVLAEAERSGAKVSPETLQACRAWLDRVESREDTPAEPRSIIASLRRQLSLVRGDSGLREEMRQIVREVREDELFDCLSQALRISRTAGLS